VKLAVGSTSAAAALAMILGFRRPVAETFHSLALVGLASGVLGGMTGLSGPPVVLLLANQATPKSDFRANLSAFFVVLGLVRLVSYRAAGLLSVGLVPPTAVLVVPTALGLWLGGWLSAVVTDEQFQRVVLGTLLVTSCLVALSGLGLI
jgi:uncharacterized membrane protein YfcA